MTETIVPCLAYNRHPGTSQVVKNPPANGRDIRDTGSIPGLGRSPGGGHGNTRQYSCLENPHGQRSLADYSPYGEAKSWTQLKRLSTQTHTMSWRNGLLSPHRLSFNTWPSNSLIRKMLLNFSWVKCLRVLLLHTYSYISLSTPAHRGRCEINFRATGGRQRHTTPLSLRPPSAAHLLQLTLSPRSTSTFPQLLQEDCALLTVPQFSSELRSIDAPEFHTQNCLKPHSQEDLQLNLQEKWSFKKVVPIYSTRNKDNEVFRQRGRIYVSPQNSPTVEVFSNIMKGKVEGHQLQL